MKIPDSNMVDMKYTKSEKKEESGEVALSSQSDYPYGLSFDLDDVSLKKLNITDLPDVGDEYHVVAVGKVTRISSSADEKDSEDRMTIQLMYMQMVHEDEEPNEKESASYENKENKQGVKVKSVITNAMR